MSRRLAAREERFDSRHSLPGPQDITRVELPNGIVVLSRANFDSASVVAGGYLVAGSLFDPDEKLGLADFTAAALMRGTQRRSFQEIYDSLESVGASLGFSGGTHVTGFNGRALAEDLELLLSLAVEALRQPVFPEEQVERLRTQLLTSLAIRAQDTGEMSSLVFDQLVYRDHPYSRPNDGYPETVQAIRQSDLVAFHQQHYGPRGLVVVIVGAVEPQRAVDSVAEALGDWHNPAQPEPPDLPPLQPLEAVSTSRVAISGKAQSDVTIGAAGPRRISPDYLAASLGNNVLGQFGMMGRLGDSIREKAGLAYYASSRLNGGSGPGPWAVSAGVDPEKVEQVVELIFHEIRRFTSQPVSSQELGDSQSNFIGGLPISLESNTGVASALVRLERYQLGLDYYQRYPELVGAVTPEQVLEAARRYLDPGRLAVSIAGP